MHDKVIHDYFGVNLEILWATVERELPKLEPGKKIHPWRAASLGIAVLSGMSYHNRIMKGITIKLPDTTLRRLKEEARATGRSVAALVRERVEAPRDRGGRSVYAVTSDLAGSVAGGRKPATNDRRRFGRS